jgi:MFS family permease
MNYPKHILLGMGANLALVGYSYVVQTFVLTYITTNLGLSRNVGLIGVVIAAVVGAVAMPLFGALADRVGTRRVIMTGAAASALFAFPFFWMLETRETPMIWLAILIGLSFCVGSIFGPIAAFYSELFDTRIRYTGLVFAREVSGSLVGGFTPLIATSLVLWSGGNSWPVSIYMIVTVLIPLACVYFARDLMSGEKRDRPVADVATQRI